MFVLTIISILAFGQSQERLSKFTNLQSYVSNLHEFVLLIYQKDINNNKTDSYLLIFGGYTLETITDQKTLSNTLYSINLKDGSIQVLHSVNNPPYSRYSSCGIIIGQKIYIYGGINENDQIINQLWQYDLSNNQWKLLGQSTIVSQCHLFAVTKKTTNDTLGIIGFQQTTSILKVIEYYFTQSLFTSNILLNLKNSISISTTTWDNQHVDSFLRLQSTSKLNISQFIMGTQPGNYFPVQNLCLVFIQENMFNIVTDNSMFLFQRTAEKQYDVVFWIERNYVGQQGILYCTSFQEWYFFIKGSESQGDSVLQQISIEYFYQPTYTGGVIHKNSPNLIIDWINPTEFFVTFIYDEALVIMDENFNLFWLQKDCNKGTTKNQNVQQCSFGLYKCKQGFTGQNCNISLCPGSIQLYDLNNYTAIQILCSNKGVCTQNGCVCDQNWTGEDCSIYKDKNCEGNLTDNFIISNCQCENPTTGGNQCNVVFCYNDCSGKGECQQNGICKCQDGYTGPDCSILEITFQLI